MPQQPQWQVSTPLELALQLSHFNIAELLLKNKALTIIKKDNQDQSLLIQAVEQNNYQIIEFLLQAESSKINVEYVNDQYQSALDLEIAKDLSANINIIKLLLSAHHKGYQCNVIQAIKNPMILKLLQVNTNEINEIKQQLHVAHETITLQKRHIEILKKEKLN